MTSVATGLQRIQEVNDDYISKYKSVSDALTKLNLKNPNPFKDLWEWYEMWSSEFASYKERRKYIRELFENLEKTLNETEKPEMVSVTVDLTDWERIERSINEIQLKLTSAKTIEQYQVIGLLSRESIISLAQSVFIPEKHPILDGTSISKTDANRMLEAYIAVELSGSTNETLRKYAKSTLSLANQLTHKRTATKKDAAICATATISLVNLIGIIEERI